MTKEKFTGFLEWILAWEIILFSGQDESYSGLRFEIIPLRIMVTILFFTSLLLFLLKPKMKADRSTVALVIIISWMLVNTVINNFMNYGISGSGSGLFIDSKIIIISSYLAISTLSFKKFREKLLKAITILSAATLTAWFLHVNFGFGSFGRAPASMFGIFMDWGSAGTEPGRMASIYWEPGMYQIIMIFILTLFFDEFRQFKLSNIKYYVQKFGIVILALVVCRSTMGYMSLMALIGISFMFNSSASRNKIIYVLLLAVAAGLVFLVWSSEVVQKKIDRDNLYRSSSLFTRIQDNVALLKTSMVSPLLGVGEGNGMLKYTRIFGDRTSSNGWLRLAALFGWPFLIFFIWNIIKNLQLMNLKIPAFLMFIPLLLSQSNEFNALFPITFIYVYKYKTYS